MADYYTTAILQPDIPADLVTNDLRAKLEALGFEHYAEDNSCLYFYAFESYTGSGEDEDGKEVTEDEVFDELHRLCQAHPDRCKWFSLELSFACSRPRPDGFGGAAVFITKDGWEILSTSGWIGERLAARGVD